MSYIPNGATGKLTKRLDTVIASLEKGQRPLYGSDDHGVLCYIRHEIQPKVVAETRREDDTNVARLHEVAKERLSRYEQKEDEHGQA